MKNHNDIKNTADVKERDGEDDLTDFISNNSTDNTVKESDVKMGAKTPILNSFCRNLNSLAEENKLQKVVGREKEIETLVEILAKKKKRNAILTGLCGIGKTAIAEGLAIMITNGEIPRALSNKRIFELNLSSVVAGTIYRGQLEERVKNIIDELKRNEDIILFIDEIHTIVGAGNAEGGMDVSNQIKPALANGELQVIGATTLDEYKKYIEKDPALTRRFERIQVDEPTVEESIIILNNIKDSYEEFHNVSYTKESIDACVKLSNRYITERNLPDKAIDIMDQVGAKVALNANVSRAKLDEIENELNPILRKKVAAIKNQQFEEAAQYKEMENELRTRYDKAKEEWEKEFKSIKYTVEESIVEEVVSKMSGIPVNKISLEESKTLLDMPNIIKKSVIGQDEAVDKVCKAIMRARVKINDPSRPISTQILQGVSGVGKTELVKQVNKFINGDEKSLIRVDMSEYRDRSSISRLIGSPAGYVGYEEGGQLTEKVRRKPYSVILLDEIEKAHPDVWNVFLQVFDDGHLTDGLGRKVDFKNTIIFMTTNIGVRKLSDFGTGIGFSSSHMKENIQNKINDFLTKEIKSVFSPEFINRIDEIIVFNTLSKEDMFKIIDIMINNLTSRMKDIKYNIQITTSAKEFLSKKGYDSEMGARPLNRTIQKYVEDEIAEMILMGNLKGGDTVEVDYKEGEEKLNFKIK